MTDPKLPFQKTTNTGTTERKRGLTAEEKLEIFNKIARAFSTRDPVNPLKAIHDILETVIKDLTAGTKTRDTLETINAILADFFDNISGMETFVEILLQKRVQEFKTKNKIPLDK